MGPGNGGVMFGTISLQGGALQHAAVVDAQRTNAARLAFSCHHQASTGVGHFTIAEPIMFDLPFLTRPFFAQGAAVRVQPPRAEWGVPQGSASVYQWERNSKGHYVGAYVSLSVSLELLEGGFYTQIPGVEMVHDLVFIGVGYKDLGSEVATEAHLITPRPVGFGGTQ